MFFKTDICPIFVMQLRCKGIKKTSRYNIPIYRYLKNFNMSTTEKSENLLQNEQTGSVISEELSNYLRLYIDKHDRANVCIKTGVSVSTLRDVMYRSNALTVRNSPALIALIAIAKKKAIESVSTSQKAIEYFKDKLITEKVS